MAERHPRQGYSDLDERQAQGVPALELDQARDSSDRPPEAGTPDAGHRPEPERAAERRGASGDEEDGADDDTESRAGGDRG